MSAVHAFEDAAGIEIDPADPRPAPAALLRRVDREPRAPRLLPPRARLPGLPERDRAGARPPRAGRAGPRAQEGRQPARRARRRPADPSGVASGSAASPTSRRVGQLTALRPELTRRSTSPRRRCAVAPASSRPRSSASRAWCRCAIPTEYPMNEGRIVSTDGLDMRPTDWEDGLRRGPGRLVERAPGADPRGRGVPARPVGAHHARRRTSSTRARPRRSRRPAWPRRSAATRSGASWRAPSSWSTPPPRRSTSSTTTARRSAPPSRGLPARASPRGRPRHRAGCSSTATSSTSAAASRPPGSCRRPARTRPPSRPT